MFLLCSIRLSSHICLSALAARVKLSAVFWGNNPLLWWLITCSAGKETCWGEGRGECCFRNHLFSLWLTRVTCRGMNSWPASRDINKTAHSIKLGHLLSKEICFTAQTAPQNKCFFQTCQTYNEKEVAIFYLLVFLCVFSFPVLFYPDKMIYNTAIFYFLVTVWADYWKAIG